MILLMIVISVIKFVLLSCGNHFRSLFGSFSKWMLLHYQNAFGSQILWNSWAVRWVALVYCWSVNFAVMWYLFYLFYQMLDGKSRVVFLVRVSVFHGNVISAVTVTEPKPNTAVLSEPWRTETEVFWSQVNTVLPSDVCVYIRNKGKSWFRRWD